MTREEVMKAFEMRVEGYTYEEIGQKLHYTKQHLSETLMRICRRAGKESCYHRELYLRVMNDYNNSMEAFCRENNVSPPSMRAFFFHGKDSAAAISAIMRAYPDASYGELMK